MTRSDSSRAHRSSSDAHITVGREEKPQLHELSRGPAKTFLGWLLCELGLLIAALVWWQSDNSFICTELSLVLPLLGIVWGACYILARLMERLACLALGGRDGRFSPKSIGLIATILFGALSAYSPLSLLIWYYALSRPLRTNKSPDLLIHDFLVTLILCLFGQLVVFLWFYRPSHARSLSLITRWTYIFILAIAVSVTIIGVLSAFAGSESVVAMWLTYMAKVLAPYRHQRIIQLAPELERLTAFVEILLITPLLVSRDDISPPLCWLSRRIPQFRRKTGVSLRFLLVIPLFVGAMSAFFQGAALGSIEDAQVTWFVFLFWVLAIALFNKARRQLLWLHHGSWIPQFYEHLALAAESGYPLTDAVVSFLQTDLPASTKAHFFRLLNFLEQGSPLHQAFSNIPEIFSASEATMLTTTDNPQSLARILRYLADLRRRRGYEIWGRRFLYLSALEAIVVALLICFLSGVVMPRLMACFSSADQILGKSSLPRFSLVVYRGGVWLVPRFLEILAITAIAFLIVSHSYATSMLARRIAWKLFPPLRDLYWATRLANFSFILSLWLRHSGSVVEGVTRAFAATGDAVLLRLADRLAQFLEQGRPLHLAVASVPILPKWFAVHLAVAARSEQLPELLELLSQNYQRQANVLRGRMIVTFSIGVAIVLCLLAVTYATAIYLLLFKTVSMVPYE